LLFVEVRDLFKRRSDEISRYLNFLSVLTNSKANCLAKKDAGGTSTIVDTYEIDRELVKTLRANGYLLLYNLVEATMTNAVDAIHRSVSAETVGFDELRGELKAIVLKHFRRAISNNNAKVLESTHPIQRAIIELGYDKKELFSGNVDAKLIRETATNYGFTIAAHDTAITRDGARLLQIKTKRNELAHGLISFEDCGHDISQDELTAIANETIAYLDAVLQGVHDYIQNKSYIASQTNSRASIAQPTVPPTS
jgi:hypothetical protein